MIDTPTPFPDVPVIFDENAIDHTPCEQTETQKRIKICKKCDKFTFQEGVTICSEKGWDINLMSLSNELTCPLGKW